MNTAADLDNELAIAIGRYVQASAALERALRTAIIRLLPVSDAIGLAVINDNSASTNREVLKRLLNLPELPIDPEWRTRLLEALPLVRASQEDRNRIAHYPLLPSSPKTYAALIEKNGERSAMEIDAKAISQWADQANELSPLFESVPLADYSNVELEKRPPTFAKKDWPQRPGRRE
jgi:hypothetical protein